ncbi:hypothetical protein [Schauerella aestuarii]|uniref:hypothetical protein n=1 Tax=Schauerella aestuarii TaxID=2511204 RepID=UPI001369916D|nr:hypothetical protein [Achromobacter aestuarii]MYZ41421.1 hypothetical protein [Achromobacter aestuarii]
MSLDKSFFVSPEIHAREVELPDGSKHQLHFRQLPAVDFRKFSLSERSDDAEVRANSIADLIASGLCNEDGSPAITRAQALKLTAPAANALFSHVVEVNKLQGGALGNESRPEAKTGSGM